MLQTRNFKSQQATLTKLNFVKIPKFQSSKLFDAFLLRASESKLLRKLK